MRHKLNRNSTIGDSTIVMIMCNDLVRPMRSARKGLEWFSKKVVRELFRSSEHKWFFSRLN